MTMIREKSWKSGFRADVAGLASRGRDEIRRHVPKNHRGIRGNRLGLKRFQGVVRAEIVKSQSGQWLVI
jgi:hypothetical protein